MKSLSNLKPVHNTLCIIYSWLPLLTEGRKVGSVSSESESSRLPNSLSSAVGVAAEASSKTELMLVSLAEEMEMESRKALDLDFSPDRELR